MFLKDKQTKLLSESMFFFSFYQSAFLPYSKTPENINLVKEKGFLESYFQPVVVWHWWLWACGSTGHQGRSPWWRSRVNSAQHCASEWNNEGGRGWDPDINPSGALLEWLNFLPLGLRHNARSCPPSLQYAGLCGRGTQVKTALCSEENKTMENCLLYNRGIRCQDISK